jgi:hypothetical protein
LRFPTWPASPFGQAAGALRVNGDVEAGRGFGSVNGLSIQNGRRGFAPLARAEDRVAFRFLAKAVDRAAPVFRAVAIEAANPAASRTERETRP